MVQHGESSTSRSKNTVQKDWADIRGSQLPDKLAFAVRAHKGWNHRENEGIARYCFVVTLEAADQTIPLYGMISTQVEIELRQEQQVQV